MTQYYYLVASLPMLFFEGPPPLRGPAWLELCREQLAEADYAQLSRVSLAAPAPLPGDHPLWRAYSPWESALRNELARQRAQRLGVDPQPFLREAPFHADLPAAVKEALSAGTPKAVEEALDRRRWRRLDELEAATQFDLGRLIAYRLKLLLLERAERFRPEPGRESFAREYAGVLDRTAAWTAAEDTSWEYGETQ